MAEEKDDVFEQIMGVVDAAEEWGLSPHTVKGLCQRGEIRCTKIGKSWVIDKNQDNPKKYKNN